VGEFIEFQNVFFDIVVSLDHIGPLFAELHDEVNGFFVELVGEVAALFGVFEGAESVFEFFVGEDCVVGVGDDSFEFFEPGGEGVGGSFSHSAVGIAEFIENFLLAQFFGFVGFGVGVAEYVVGGDFIVESLPGAETGV